MVGTSRNSVTELELAGTFDANHLSLSIKGDGSALPQESAKLPNVMLESLRHRIRAIGGTMQLASPANGGFFLSLSAPMANIVGIL